MPKTSVTEALKRILEDDHWIRKVLLGGFLLAIPVAFFFAKGYVLQVFRAAIRGETEEGLPAWEAGESFVLGAKAFVIWILYYLLPAVFFFAARGFCETAAYETFLVIAIVLTVIATALLPWGAANWLSTNCVKNAFDFRRLTKVFGFFGEYVDVLVRCFLLLIFSVGTVFTAFFVSLACVHLLGEVTGRYLRGEEEAPAQPA
jgi:hypothetical protein